MAKPDEVKALLKKGIKTDKKALAMLKKLKMRAKETIEKELAFFQGEDNFIVSYVNVNGLSKKHYKNLTLLENCSMKIIEKRQLHYENSEKR